MVVADESGGGISDIVVYVARECEIHGDEGEAEALGTLSASSQRRCSSPEKRRARKEHSSNAKPSSRATSDSNANVVVSCPFGCFVFQGRGVPVRVLGSDEDSQIAMLGLRRRGAASRANRAAVAWL